MAKAKVTERYRVESLRTFAASLFIAAGMDADKAVVVADTLVTGDMVGQRTHGMALCPQYIDQIEQGLMATHGEPAVIRDSDSLFVWDGAYLPGPWLVSKAIGQACERVGTQGVVTGVIRRSHHIACLTASLRQATERGYLILLASSDPAFGFVAPHGGKEPLLTPNPIAFGYPGARQPVWIDISASITTVGMARQKAAAGERFAYPWLMDAEGWPSDDPHVLDPGAGGSLLPLGGLEYGHKGFGLLLMVEMLTHGLAGFGRPDAEKRWGAGVFLQVLDPQAFGGREDFLRLADDMTARCHANAPRDPASPVRLPGEMAQRRMREAERSGIELPAPVYAALADKARQYGVQLPEPINSGV